MSTAFSTPFGAAKTQDGKAVAKESKAALTSNVVIDTQLIYTIVTSTLITPLL